MKFAEALLLSILFVLTLERSVFANGTPYMDLILPIAFFSVLAYTLWKVIKNRKGEGSRSVVAIKITVLAIAVLFFLGSVLAILDKAANPPYQAKAADLAGQDDLRNARIILEAYFMDHGKYPDALTQTKFRPSPNVDIVYKKLSPKKYRIASSHRNGFKEYRCSENTGIEWRYTKNPDKSMSADTTTWHKD